MFLPLKFEIINQNGRFDLFNETFGTSDNRERRASFALDLTKLNSANFTGPNVNNTPV